jgi:hypothetical protein
MAAVLACGPEAVLSRRSAGQLWGIGPPADRWPEVMRASVCHGLAGIAVHRGSIPADEREELRPDCMWPAQRLIAELDGRDVHRTDRAFEGDRQRDRILLVEGWRSTRVTWRQLHGEPAAIAADLRDLLKA